MPKSTALGFMLTTATIGQQAKLVNGDVVQGWTITGLKPSSDAIPYTPQGTLSGGHSDQ